MLFSKPFRLASSSLCNFINLSTEESEFYFNYRQIKSPSHSPDTCDSSAFDFGHALCEHNVGSRARVPDARACQRECASDHHCHFWTFYEDGKVCKLKDDTALCGRFEAKHGDVVSGPKTCGKG